MQRLRVTWLSIGLVACTAALLPTTAPAALPQPRSAVVKPFRSMGGLELSSTLAKAQRKWGSGNGCGQVKGGDRNCVWFDQASTDFPVESASIRISAGEICGIAIRAGTNRESGRLLVSQLKKWKTKRRNVGLDSKIATAKRERGELAVKKRGVTTAFKRGNTPRSKRRVEAITIYERGCQALVEPEPGTRRPAR